MGWDVKIRLSRALPGSCNNCVLGGVASCLSTSRTLNIPVCTGSAYYVCDDPRLIARIRLLDTALISTRRISAMRDLLKDMLHKEVR